MIHKIKALHDNGQGLSVRAISKQLSISRNTVRKYLRLSEEAIQGQQSDPSRSKKLDDYRSYLVYLLGEFPKLSAVKVARKLKTKYGSIPASDRSLRRYIQQLRQEVAVAQVRYFEPIIDDVAGVQCQVDPGELRGVRIGDQEVTLHFVVFVLSFSRLMYVGLSFQPLDTQAFIQLHDEAFRYFGGITEECVYDQTKLVVIKEQYREIEANQRFYQYATTAGFRIHACEGYDPQSKGKVEAGVKYVKQDCFYGEHFTSQQAVRDHLQNWLDEVANCREHGTTGQIPHTVFMAEERTQLKPYLAPSSLRQPSAIETRRADKTGLISYQANKYSVPLAWQQAQVGVMQQEDHLVITDLNTGEILAEHALCLEKGRIIKNNNHYRDREARVAQLEVEISQMLGDQLGQTLCQQIRRSEPRVVKDQLVALKSILAHLEPEDRTLLAQLAERPGITAGKIKRYLEAERQARSKGRYPDHGLPEATSANNVDLSAYQRLGQSSGQEVTHGPA
ncbi:IS21 family transposase [Marinospirillum perlucidum]|uniref:IS21 family transposase n=1 Tax=Marinospirillum perlucidum TaxID=1982602 RepID=UPI000DF42C47|nr:IS21 family transposase [Marinospirillum perlucidum]